LYKGNQYAPLRFDTPGAVVLGCNIHDGMLGYILVVDTPYFALTDSRGTVRLDAMPDGEYTVHVWTPRARSDALPQGVRLTVRDATAPQLTVELQGQLMPAHENHGGGSLTWERY